MTDRTCKNNMPSDLLSRGHKKGKVWTFVRKTLTTLLYCSMGYHFKILKSLGTIDCKHGQSENDEFVLYW